MNCCAVYVSSHWRWVNLVLGLVALVSIWILLPIVAPAPPRAAPMFVPPQPAVRLAVVADVQPRNERHLKIGRWHGKVMAKIDPAPDVVVVLGDLRGQYGPQQLPVLIHDLFAPLYQKNLPVLLHIGNHDLPVDEFVARCDPFGVLANMGATNLSTLPEDFDLTYSFDYEGIHVVFLNPYSVFPPNITEHALEWLRSDFEQNLGKPTVVLCHEPAYPVAGNFHSSLNRDIAMRDRLWQLFDEYGIAAFLCAHEHIYHRRVIDASVNTAWQQRILQICSAAFCKPRRKLASASYDQCLWGLGFLVLDIAPDRLWVQFFSANGRRRDFYEMPILPLRKNLKHS